ncbi:uncharacterized protein LOC143177965 [Calliopsis andreniformis]|uniref:uncharacterized protein LOC143177965 n=1 Tax=Calliopsis andreniformis TaxID=337506 RepID=UPI003FCDA8FE
MPKRAGKRRTYRANLERIMDNLLQIPAPILPIPESVLGPHRETQSKPTVRSNVPVDPGTRIMVAGAVPGLYPEGAPVLVPTKAAAPAEDAPAVQPPEETWSLPVTPTRPITPDPGPLPKPTIPYRLVQVDVPEPDWNQYKNLPENDPRKNLWQIGSLFGTGAAGPPNSNGNCRCARCTRPPKEDTSQRRKTKEIPKALKKQWVKSKSRLDLSRTRDSVRGEV